MNISASANSTIGSHCPFAGAANAGTSSARWMGPVSSTPCDSSHGAAAMPATMTTKTAGKRGMRCRMNRLKRAPRPAARLIGCQAPTPRKSSHNSAKKSVLWACTATICGHCFTVMTSASPKAKPRSTGRAIRFDIAPSRAPPASKNAIPVAHTRIDAIAMRCATVWAPSASIAAASTAADDDVAPTMA